MRRKGKLNYLLSISYNLLLSLNAFGEFVGYCTGWAAAQGQRSPAASLGLQFGKAFPGTANRHLATALLLCAAFFAMPASAELLHRERSLYQTILITKQASTICLQFSQRRAQRRQSCFDKHQPRQMALTYTKMMMSALLLTPSPRRALVIGLGGGTLPMALSALYPEAHVDVVEIDPAVVKLAQRYFGFSESGRLKVHVQDGRVFVRRAAQEGSDRYDLIMLDAFGADYIPEHLITREFLQEAKALLSAGGALAANTFASSALYDHESATYQAVFGPFFNLRTAASGNRIILAGRDALPSLMTLGTRAKGLAPTLRPYGVDIQDYPTRLNSKVDWDQDARILTDQYAPANLLQGR